VSLSALAILVHLGTFPLTRYRRRAGKKAEVLTESPFKVQLEDQVAEKNKNKKTEVQRKRITFGKWRAANVGRKSTAVLVVLSSSQNLQTKTGSSVVLVRNGGMKHAHHMKGEFCL
jgi:hypothetical protein